MHEQLPPLKRWHYAVIVAACVLAMIDGLFVVGDAVIIPPPR